MKDFNVRKITNGYILTEYGAPEPGMIGPEEQTFFNTLTHAAEYIALRDDGPCLSGNATAWESPQDTDSTETVEKTRPFPTHMKDGVPHWEDMTESEIEAHKEVAEPVQPMADLSTSEIQPLADQASQAFDYYQANGGYTPPPAETD